MGLMQLIRKLKNTYDYKVSIKKNQMIETEYSTNNICNIEAIYLYANNYNMYRTFSMSIFREFATIGVLLEYHTDKENELTTAKQLLKFTQLLSLTGVNYIVLNQDETENNNIFIKGNLRQISNAILEGFDYFYDEYSDNEFLNVFRNSLYNFEPYGFNENIIENSIMDKDQFIYETMYNNPFRLNYKEIVNDMLSKDGVEIIEYDHFEVLSNGKVGCNYDLVEIMQLSDVIFISSKEYIPYKARFKDANGRWIYKAKAADLFKYLAENGDFIYDSYLDCAGFNCIADIDKIFGREYECASTTSYDPYKNIDEVL